MKKWLFVLAVLAFAACGTNIPAEEAPKNLIEREKFIQVMKDVQLLEAIRKQKMIREDDPESTLASYYKQVFEKHQITEESFTQTFTWYYGQPKEMIEIYEAVFEELSLMQGEELKD
jgi:hypothetical protein